MRCSYCGSNYHTTVNCPKTSQGQDNRNNMRCSYCGSNKHNINACPKTFQGNADRAWNEERISNDFVKD
jgi:hypothetical protein